MTRLLYILIHPVVRLVLGEKWLGSALARWNGYDDGQKRWEWYALAENSKLLAEYVRVTSFNNRVAAFMQDGVFKLSDLVTKCTSSGLFQARRGSAEAIGSCATRSMERSNCGVDFAVAKGIRRICVMPYSLFLIDAARGNTTTMVF